MARNPQHRIPNSDSQSQPLPEKVWGVIDSGWVPREHKMLKGHLPRVI